VASWKEEASGGKLLLVEAPLADNRLVELLRKQPGGNAASVERAGTYKDPCR